MQADRLAHEINKRIRKAAEELGPRALGKRPVEFFCECGCRKRVGLQLREFRAVGSAWLDGHEPGR